MASPSGPPGGEASQDRITMSGVPLPAQVEGFIISTIEQHVKDLGEALGRLQNDINSIPQGGAAFRLEEFSILFDVAAEDVVKKYKVLGNDKSPPVNSAEYTTIKEHKLKDICLTKNWIIRVAQVRQDKNEEMENKKKEGVKVKLETSTHAMESSSHAGGSADLIISKVKQEVEHLGEALKRLQKAFDSIHQDGAAFRLEEFSILFHAAAPEDVVKKYQVLGEDRTPPPADLHLQYTTTEHKLKDDICLTKNWIIRVAQVRQQKEKKEKEEEEKKKKEEEEGKKKKEKENRSVGGGSSHAQKNKMKQRN